MLRNQLHKNQASGGTAGGRPIAEQAHPAQTRMAPRMQSRHDVPEPTGCQERIEQNPGLPERPRCMWWVRWSPLFIAVFVLVASTAGAFLFYQARYGRIVEEELRKGAFTDTVSVFVNSKTLVLGATASAAETVDDLRRAGFTESRENPIGWFESRGETLVIHAASQAESAMLKFSANKIVQILAVPNNSKLAQYQLNAQLIANVSLRNRERRRLLRFDEIPKILIDAVLSVEDKRFFGHRAGSICFESSRRRT